MCDREDNLRGLLTYCYVRLDLSEAFNATVHGHIVYMQLCMTHMREGALYDHTFLETCMHVWSRVRTSGNTGMKFHSILNPGRPAVSVQSVT